MSSNDFRHLRITLAGQWRPAPFVQENPYKDPCDRLIIAAALIHHLPVVTTDMRFAEYGVEVMQ